MNKKDDSATKTLNQTYKKLFKTMENTSKLHFGEGFRFGDKSFVIDGYLNIPLYGGLNSGTGKWNEYLLDISKVCSELQKTYKEVYLVSIDTDVDDDVFYAIIRVR